MGEQEKRTATQRIEDLERAVVGSYQAMDQMSRDLMTLKEAIKLLGNKVDSIVKVLNSGQELNDQNIGNAMIANNIEELRGKVTSMVDQGFFKAQETATRQSFVVGQEVNDADEVVQPRIQFAVGNLPETLSSKLEGAKAGDLLTLEEGKLKFRLLETYEIVAPSNEASAPAAEAAAKSATEVGESTESDATVVDQAASQ